MPVADTPNKRNNSSIHRDEMPLTETQLTHGDLNENALSRNTLECEKITNIQKEHQYARSTEQVSSVCTCTSVCEYCKHQLLKLEQENLTLQNKVKELEIALEELKSTTTGTTATSHDINKICHSDELILLHTGLKSYPLFTSHTHRVISWIVVQEKRPNNNSEPAQLLPGHTQEYLSQEENLLGLKLSSFQNDPPHLPPFWISTAPK